MDKKTKPAAKADDSKTILDIIIFAGVILDTYSVYGFWKDLNDEKTINKMMSDNGVPAADLGLEQIIGSMQKGLSLMLIVFLIFDYIAFYNLYDYKNWARKYVLSIGIMYMVSCLFSFSLPYFLYAAFTIYFLWKKPAAEFFQ